MVAEERVGLLKQGPERVDAKVVSSFAGDVPHV